MGCASARLCLWVLINAVSASLTCEYFDFGCIRRQLDCWLLVCLFIYVKVVLWLWFAAFPLRAVHNPTPIPSKYAQRLQCVSRHAVHTMNNFCAQLHFAMGPKFFSGHHPIAQKSHLYYFLHQSRWRRLDGDRVKRPVLCVKYKLRSQDNRCVCTTTL